MKAYFSFFLVFLFLYLLIFLSNTYNSIHQNFSDHLYIVKFSQYALDLKHDLIIAAKYGAKEGLEEYLLTKNPDEPYDSKKAEEFIKLNIYKKFLLLKPNYKDIDIEFWCGMPGKIELRNLPKKMRDEKKLLKCSNCYSLSSLECADYINIDADDPTNIKIKLGDGLKLIGFSMYSKRYDTSGTYYIPPNMVIK